MAFDLIAPPRHLAPEDNAPGTEDDDHRQQHGQILASQAQDVVQVHDGAFLTETVFLSPASV